MKSAALASFQSAAAPEARIGGERDDPPAGDGRQRLWFQVGDRVTVAGVVTDVNGYGDPTVKLDGGDERVYERGVSIQHNAPPETKRPKNIPIDPTSAPFHNITRIVLTPTRTLLTSDVSCARFWVRELHITTQPAIGPEQEYHLNIFSDSATGLDLIDMDKQQAAGAAPAGLVADLVQLVAELQAGEAQERAESRKGSWPPGSWNRGCAEGLYRCQLKLADLLDKHAPGWQR